MVDIETDKPPQTKDRLYVVRNQNWGQIVGVYNWTGLKDLLHCFERNEWPVERDGHCEQLTIDSIDAINRTRVSDDNIRQMTVFYGKTSEKDEREEDVLWQNARIGAADECNAFQVAPRVVPVTDLLLEIAKL